MNARWSAALIVRTTYWLTSAERYPTSRRLDDSSDLQGGDGEPRDCVGRIGARGLEPLLQPGDVGGLTVGAAGGLADDGRAR